MRIAVECEIERKTIAFMEVEREPLDLVTAEMINTAWEPVSEEYRIDHEVAAGDFIACPHCGGPLSFHSQ